MLHITDKIIKHKVGLLNLAEEFGNVSKACQVIGLISGHILSLQTGGRCRRGRSPDCAHPPQAKFGQPG